MFERKRTPMCGNTDLSCWLQRTNPGYCTNVLRYLSSLKQIGHSHKHTTYTYSGILNNKENYCVSKCQRETIIRAAEEHLFNTFFLARLQFSLSICKSSSTCFISACKVAFSSFNPATHNNVRDCWFSATNHWRVPCVYCWGFPEGHCCQ